MSPTAPTSVALNDQLNKAHRRIHELQARETELLAQNRTLCAVITELIDEDARTATLCRVRCPPRRLMMAVMAVSASARAQVRG